MELKTNREVREELRGVRTLERRDALFDKVAGKQIISAMLHEINKRFASGYLYEVLQGAANEARRRGLLINPNRASRETYSTAVGNTDRMLPSAQGWEMTKGILTRHLLEARAYLEGLLAQRAERRNVAGVHPDSLRQPRGVRRRSYGTVR